MISVNSLHEITSFKKNAISYCIPTSWASEVFDVKCFNISVYQGKVYLISFKGVTRKSAQTSPNMLLYAYLYSNILFCFILSILQFIQNCNILFRPQINYIKFKNQDCKINNVLMHFKVKLKQNPENKLDICTAFLNLKKHISIKLAAILLIPNINMFTKCERSFKKLNIIHDFNFAFNLGGKCHIPRYLSLPETYNFWKTITKLFRILR